MNGSQVSFIQYPDQNLVAHLPIDERPVSRLCTYTASALSKAELLAILIGGASQIETAQKLLTRYGTLGKMCRAPINELSQIDGIGRTTAAKLKASLEIGRRQSLEMDDLPQIRSPANAANLVMMDMSTLEQEQLRLMLLDTKNKVLKIVTVYIGNLNTSVIRVGEMLRYALRENCAGIIIVHNHPSGDPEPSPEDVRVTERIVAAGKMLDIDVLDHLIIGQQRFTSMKERRLGFS